MTLVLEEHKPLRPISVFILLTHHTQQQIAYRLDAAKREEHLNGSLTHIARTPPAAGVLLQTSRREVVHKSIVCVPGHHIGDTRNVLGEWARSRRTYGQSRYEVIAAFDAQRRPRSLTDQLSSNTQADQSGGRGNHTQIWLLVGKPIDE
jgi:hypothetical protein